jgi:phosphonate metabolism protein PhnN/1,5-bisphosphokinase (PRPP-forming)
VLIGVVGPSGAGKDTLMAGARAALADDASYVFVRRVITRPAEAGGEAHEAVSEDAFAALRGSGALALWWQAHGLHYGIPAAIAAEIAAGRVVVANLSRGVLAEAASRFPLRVLHITAPVALRAARLAARGREEIDDIAARLAREAPLPPGLEVETVSNDGTPEAGVAQVVAALSRAVADARRAGRARPVPAG